MSGGDDDGADREREVAELRRQLAVERELRRAVIDHAPDYIVHCDLAGRILFTNRTVSGKRPEEVIGYDVVTLASPDQQAPIREALATVASTGQSTDVELSASLPGRAPAAFHARIAPVRDASGTPTSLVIFVSSVERLKEAERQARARDARLRLVLEASQIAICEVDLVAGMVVDMDARFRDLGELWGRTLPVPLLEVLALAHPEDRGKLVETIESLRPAGSYRMLDFRMIRRSSGEIRWLRGTGKLRADLPGLRLVAGLEDITLEKTFEAQLVQAAKLESIGRLAGGVAHDFNNLLTVVMASTAIAETKLAAGRAPHDELGDIRVAAERGAALTNQLLTFARRQIVEPRVLAPSEVVRDVERLLSRILGEDIAIAMICQARGHVRVDPHQLEQVLVNLATNARDAMPRGGRLTLETSDVTLDAAYVARHADAQPGPYVMIAVSDTGGGMGRDTLEHLFEPFFTTKPFGQGTGLGLATCHGIVRQAGGSIQVYSEVGHGTTFRIYLPRVDAAVERGDAGRPVVVPRGTETILLVEDEEPIRRVLAEALRELGYDVLTAAGADDAFRIAREHAGPIHVVVTDVVMPDIGAHELAERFAQMHPDTAILFVSGYTQNAIVHHGVLDAGVHFLQKPFSPTELHARIRQILDARRS